MRLCICVSEFFQVKDRQPLTEKLLESISLQKAKITGKLVSRKDLQSTNLGWITWILAKLSFIELCDVKLSCLHTFTTQPFPCEIWH